MGSQSWNCCIRISFVIDWWLLLWCPCFDLANWNMIDQEKCERREAGCSVHFGGEEACWALGSNSVSEASKLWLGSGGNLSVFKLPLPHLKNGGSNMELTAVGYWVLCMWWLLSTSCMLSQSSMKTRWSGTVTYPHFTDVERSPWVKWLM